MLSCTMISAEVEPIKLDDGKLKCNVCGWTFKTEHGYVIHQLGSRHLTELFREWGRRIEETFENPRDFGAKVDEDESPSTP